MSYFFFPFFSTPLISIHLLDKADKGRPYETTTLLNFCCSYTAAPR